MKAGKSVCHQMIMGAGKTTVVGPLVAMLVASSKTMVSSVCIEEARLLRSVTFICEDSCFGMMDSQQICVTLYSYYPC
jgi:hypothetical protein